MSNVKAAMLISSGVHEGGGYDKVAARIREFNDKGIEMRMLQFQPFEREIRRFAEELSPLARFEFEAVGRRG